MQYHILCSLPGLRRGGRENHAYAAYSAGDHTPEQLHALLDEPAIIVVIGERMTAEHVRAAKAWDENMAQAALEEHAARVAPPAETAKPTKAKG